MGSPPRKEVKGIIPQLSVALGDVKVTTAPQVLVVAFTTIGAGQVTIGPVTSFFSIVIVQVLSLPDASLTVKVTIMLPLLLTSEPAAGLCVITKEPVGVQLSLTVSRLL